VVDVTTSGAVPVATLDISCGAVTLAVASTWAVPILPTFALPVALKVVANTPVVPKLATLALPDTDSVPAMFAPVLVTTNLLAPVTAIAMFAFAVRLMLLLPFCNKPLLIVVILPVVIIAVVVPILPMLALPDTLRVVRVPIEVIFGCAAVVSVPVI